MGTATGLAKGVASNVAGAVTGTVEFLKDPIDNTVEAVKSAVDVVSHPVVTAEKAINAVNASAESYETTLDLYRMQQDEGAAEEYKASIAGQLLGGGAAGIAIKKGVDATIDAVQASNAAKIAEVAKQERIVENNFYSEGDSYFAQTQIDLKNKAAEVRSTNTDMFEDGKPVGNIATATIRVEGQNVQEVKSFSRYGDNEANQVDNFVSLSSNNEPILKALDNPNSPVNRMTDTEYKILENFAQTYKDTPNIQGSIDLFTERAPCKSCTNVIEQQFSIKYPNVQVRVYHDNGSYSIYQGGKIISTPMGTPRNPGGFPTAPTFNSGDK
ncbi:deaminase domain-containing protein [Acinetobacter populi]|uniref:Uncharacterized protein n=1 Tax=Acinetobacter populi TaxID=1582270 RepID=A0A1Z9YUH6_9GAMM|nr:deaminase domain-containing protein [Acinetobacter populi]OUY05874.1 hypothetical protein CAP51_14225 [Acinetobacter populi]